MTALTQPLRDEHRELLPHIECIKVVADSVGEIPLTALRQSVDDVYDFLTHKLIPHAHAEDHAMYPAVGRVLGADQATATMRRDHTEVGRLTEELAAIRSQMSGRTLEPTEAKALRRVLYGLYAIIKLHFAKEEEIYLPLLDVGMSAHELEQMFAAMEEAAHEHGAHPAH